MNHNLRDADFPVPASRDVPYPLRLQLHVDSQDVERGILRVREVIPLAGTEPITLLFPEWVPGYHAPQASIELFAGLTIKAGETELPWRRHPVQVHAFQVDVPDDVQQIEAAFQFLTPTDPSQGRVVIGKEILSLQWNSVLLYPAGYYARQIEFDTFLTVPHGWQHACAIAAVARDDDTIRFETTSLDILVDSPVFAGRFTARLPLDDQQKVHLNLFADSEELIDISEEWIAPHREVVKQAEILFGPAPFDRFEMLLALSAELGAIGVEHHRSFEAVTAPNYLTDWDATFSLRETVPHEFIHAWNGKYRCGSDSWTPSFDQPIRNSLMWVYEGQTQYWDRVLCCRAGLWTADQTLQAIATTAATHEVRAGSRWRPISDTTRDPIIAARAPLPWPSWQRSEDYYSEGSLVWLDIDTRIRALSNDTRSLDDFARSFFAADKEGGVRTLTYTLDDVIAALTDLAPFDWAGFLRDKINGKHSGAPLDGIERGGYQLLFRDEPSEFWTNTEQLAGNVNLMFSLGFTADCEGKIEEVLWQGPAFEAALTAGAHIMTVEGQPFSADRLRDAVRNAPHSGGVVRLRVRAGIREKEVEVRCPNGLRYPHLAPRPGARLRLLEILSPRS